MNEELEPKLPNHDDVVGAIEALRQVRVTWPSQDDGGSIQTRLCAPMDYGPSRRALSQPSRYHFWDFESDSGKNHTLSLRADQIVSVEVLDSTFDPSDFATWDVGASAWFTPRTTWGAHG